MPGQGREGEARAYTVDVDASRLLDDPGCMHSDVHELEDAKIVKTSTGQDVLIVRILDLEASWIPMASDYRGRFWTERAHACRLDDKGIATCEGPVNLASAREDFIGDRTTRRTT